MWRGAAFFVSILTLPVYPAAFASATCAPAVFTSEAGSFFFDDSTSGLAAARDLFAGGSLRCRNVSASVSWPGNVLHHANTSSKKDGAVVLLPGGSLHLRTHGWGLGRDVDPLLSNWTFAVDVKIPPREVMAKTSSAQLSTLIPLLHLGKDPLERISLGFATCVSSFRQPLC